MEAVRVELRKLARGYAGALGAMRAARWHLLVLVAAILLAFVHRSIHALPGFDRLAGHWIPAILAGVALYFAAPLLHLAATLFGRPRVDALARELDDRFRWGDATETALTLTPEERELAVPGFLIEQARGRVREVNPRKLARVRTPRRWPRRVLAFVFVALLLLPGVDGLFGRFGAGTQGDGSIGSEGPEDPVGAARPMAADFWLQTFVENPLAVEPLPETGAPPKDQPNKAGGK